MSDGKAQGTLRRATVLAALAGAVLVTTSCSNTVTGQPTGSAIAAITTKMQSTVESPSSSTAETHPGGSEPSRADETLILGTSQPGTHEFILNSGYDPTLIAQGVGFILTSAPPSGYGYEVSDISGIKCPASKSVTAGTSFTCTVSLGFAC